MVNTKELWKEKTMAEESTGVEEEQEEKTAISLVDVQNLLHIIDVAAGRGAFKGEELSQVGGVRDKVAKFLAENTPVAGTENGEAVSEVVAEDAPVEEAVVEVPVEESKPKKSTKKKAA